MTFAILRLGGASDLATFYTLARELPGVLDTPWEALVGADPAGPALLLNAALAGPTVTSLRRKGVAVVRVERHGDGVAYEHRGQRAVWPAVETLGAASLATLLRPVPVGGDPVVEEAWFLVALDAPGAHATLERLLALGRDDASVSELDDDGRPSLLIRVTAPPMYLLLRAREEPAEGVTAFARAHDQSLWVAWSYAHPLAGPIDTQLRARHQTALVDAAGRWRVFDAALATRSIYDILVPTLAAEPVLMTAEPGQRRFQIALRLGLGPLTEPELWLLNAAQFAALEALVESLTADELRRFTVSRLGSAENDGPYYLLHELVRPNVPRMATRVSDLAGVKGFCRSPGTDNLYLPEGRRLQPAMRRDELRALLNLERNRYVILDERQGRLRRYEVASTDDAPLSEWVDFVATDQRTVLDRWLEEAPFAWPELSIERRPRDVEVAARATQDEAPQPPRPRPKKAKEINEVQATAVAPGVDPHAALRAEIRQLEIAVAAGGVDDGAVWSALGDRKAQVSEHDEAAVCFENAVFFEPEAGERVGRAAQLRMRLADKRGSAEELYELVTAQRITPNEAAYLGLRLIEMAAAGGGDDALLQEGGRRFLSPEYPVSRRLAWSVLRALHTRSGDRLGMTRAKEQLLGAINDRGLSDTFDLPRFVRYALALAGTERQDSTLRLRSEQGVLLDGLWRDAVDAGLVRELDPFSNYLRLAFGVGYTRLAAAQRAKELVEPVERELSVHEAPNRVLFGLYLARMAHIATRGDDAAWKREVDERLKACPDARTRDRVEHLRKRSAWLRTESPSSTDPELRPAYHKMAAAAEVDVGAAPETLGRILDDRGVYDYEKEEVVRRLMRSAKASGNDGALSQLLAVCTGRLATKIGQPGYRVRSAGHCMGAAGVLGDVEALDRLLDEVVTVCESPAVPQMADLIDAVKPAILALRRFGATRSARRFLETLVPIASRPGPRSAQLRAILSEGFLRLGDRPRADELLRETLGATLEATMPHADRYFAGAAILNALRYWPTQDRAAESARLLKGIEVFTDTFTASTMKLYPTFKVQLIEQLVDAVGDEVTFESDKVQGYLDEEEQVLRRRIVADWRVVCGA
ncbi:MAG: hypothetical protein JNK72_21160 [Myxococcales bacterium]|nr:hypothetical protein [Myxococcales bacterium]